MTKTTLMLIIVIAILSIALPIAVVLLVDRKRKMHLWLKIAIPVITILVVNIGGSFIYFSIHYKATSEVNEYLKDDSEVKVTNTKDYYLFDNLTNNDKAVIFYGGAKVEEDSYAPMLNKLAHEGVDVYVAKMPFCFALFNRTKADAIYNDAYKEVYLMGHSLGGVCCAMNLDSTKLDYKGVVFLASYPSKQMDNKYKSLTIYGSEDKVMNKKEFDKNQTYLPNDHDIKVIEGGNHANYGYYGKQKGDGEATISREQQIDLTVSYVKDFIN